MSKRDLEQSDASACARERWPEFNRADYIDCSNGWGPWRKAEGAKQWRWPFRQMEVGDWLYIEPGEIPIEKVRARAHNIGGDFKFSVTQDSQGLIRVMRVLEAGVGYDVVSYRVVHAKLTKHYRTDDPEIMMTAAAQAGQPDLGMIIWQTLTEDGQSAFQKLEQVSEPMRKAYVFSAAARPECRFALELERDGVRITRVPRDMTQDAWDAQRLQEALS